MSDRSQPAGLTVRHYCQGIGDCHLLSFLKSDGSPFWILIDCGIHSSIAGGPKLMDEVVRDIKQLTGGHVDVLVLTHEHTDHLSAFGPSSDRFSGFTIDEIWMGWTESTDPQALRLDKFKQQALSALSDASQRLNAASALTPVMEATRSGVDALLSFNFGVKGESVRALRKAAESLAAGAIKYCEPGKPPITFPGLPNLRVYVLAPSRNEKYLSITERSGEMYHMASDVDGLRIASSLSSAFAATTEGSELPDPAAPFDPCNGTSLSSLARPGEQDGDEGNMRAFARDHYFGPAIAIESTVRPRRSRKTSDAALTDQSWRRIDHDWLGPSADLAMQLDNKTNNTSLVLAFELVQSRRVFLFAADAQVGNWLSWKDASWTLDDGSIVDGLDLLRRTVYYKVGHHGSQNATLESNGLELMTHQDLSAFIPTNEEDAKKVKWGQMPFPGIVAALEAHCASRVMRADDKWLLGASAAPFQVPSGSIRRLAVGPAGSGDSDTRKRWVELDLT